MSHRKNKTLQEQVEERSSQISSQRAQRRRDMLDRRRLENDRQRLENDTNTQHREIEINNNEDERMFNTQEMNEIFNMEEFVNGNEFVEQEITDNNRNVEINEEEQYDPPQAQHVDNSMYEFRFVNEEDNQTFRTVEKDERNMYKRVEKEEIGSIRNIEKEEITMNREIEKEEIGSIRNIEKEETSMFKNVEKENKENTSSIRNIEVEEITMNREIEKEEIGTNRNIEKEETSMFKNVEKENKENTSSIRNIEVEDEESVEIPQAQEVDDSMYDFKIIDHQEQNEDCEENSFSFLTDLDQGIEIQEAQELDNFDYNLMEQDHEESEHFYLYRDITIINEEEPRRIHLSPVEIEMNTIRNIQRYPVEETRAVRMENRELTQHRDNISIPNEEEAREIEINPQNTLDDILEQIERFIAENVDYLNNKEEFTRMYSERDLSAVIKIIDENEDDQWIQMNPENKIELLLSLGRIPANVELPDTVITVTLYTMDGNEHVFTLDAMKAENIPLTRTEWREYYDPFQESGEVLVAPVEEIVGVELNVTHRPVNVTPNMHRLQGNFFPYYIHPSSIEMKELFTALEIFEEKDWAPKENCFYMALVHWNDYLKKTNQEIKCIPENTLRKIKFRLRGNGLAKSNLNQIGKDFHLQFIISIVTIKERLNENLEQYIKNHRIKEVLGANNGREVRLGLIVIKEQGHYFANYQTYITVAGLKHYHWLKKYKQPFWSGNRQVPAKTLQERLSVVTVKESQGMKVVWNDKTKNTPTLDTAGVLQLMVKLNETSKQKYLIEIPNYMLYRGFCSGLDKKRIIDIDLNERIDPDYKEISYVEKTKKIIPFVSDTECATNNRHRPYAISYSKLEENTPIKTFIGSDCITQFMQSMNLFMKRNVKKTNSKENGHIYQDYEVVVYFHNLSYDGRMFCDQKITSIKMSSNRIIEMVLLLESGYKLTLRDSLMLINFKLADFPKLFKFEDESKKIFPYTFIELEKTNESEYKVSLDEIIDSQNWKNEEKEEFIKGLEKDKLIDGNGNIVDVKAMIKSYIESDIRIMKKGMLIFRNDVKKTLGLDLVQYISISSIAFDYMKREAFTKENIYQYTGELRDFIRQAVYGGRCMTRGNNAYKLDNIRIDDIDACSLYPSAMSKLTIPKGYPKKKENPTREWLEQGLQNKTINAAVVRIVITNIGKTLQFPLICERDKNGVVQYENYIGGEMVVDDIQLLEMIKWQKIDYEIHECIYWDQGESDKIQKVIKHLYEKRQEEKRNKSTLEQVYKLIMNSSYGKCIEMSHPYETVIVDGHHYVNHLFQNYTNIQRIDEIASFDREIVDNPMEEENVDENRQYIFREYKQYDNFFVPTIIGVRILSMSKKLMNEVMVPAELSGILIFYQDTDSMHVLSHQVNDLEEAWRLHNGKGPEEKLIGNNLCQFHSDFEPINGNPTESCGSIFLGKKMYIDKLIPKGEIFSNEIKYMTRLKGIPRASLMNYDIDGFEKKDESKLWKIYEKIFDGCSIEFELVVDRVKMSFTRHLEVQTINSFKRKANTPKCLCYELNENDEMIIFDRQ